MTGEALWRQYCGNADIPVNTPHDEWAFCGGGPMADELAELVLQGKKFGTAGLYESYLCENEPVPDERAYSVILNSEGQAVCVIRDYEVRIDPFLRVSEFHGYSEGEEERNLTAWRRIHRQVFAADLKEVGLDKVEDGRVVQEKFTLEYVAEEYRESAAPTEDFFLIEPNIRYREEITAYREEMLAFQSSMDGCMSLKRMADPEEWVNYSYEWGNPLRELGEKGIRGTLLMCIRKSDDKLIGMVQIRKIPPTHEKAYVGHIGYSVRPGERRKGYATKMLRKALEYLKYGLSMETAEISALPENEASKKTILANGGVYRDTVELPGENVRLDRFTVDLKNKF